MINKMLRQIFLVSTLTYETNQILQEVFNLCMTICLSCLICFIVVIILYYRNIGNQLTKDISDAIGVSTIY